MTNVNNDIVCGSDELNSLEEFVTENSTLIDRYMFDEVYELASKYDKYGGFTTNMFSLLLIKNGINPLDYMTFIPDHFINKLNITDIKIPSNIKKIGKFAFYECQNLSST